MHTLSHIHKRVPIMYWDSIALNLAPKLLKQVCWKRKGRKIKYGPSFWKNLVYYYKPWTDEMNILWYCQFSSPYFLFWMLLGWLVLITRRKSWWHHPLKKNKSIKNKSINKKNSSPYLNFLGSQITLVMLCFVYSNSALWVSTIVCFFCIFNYDMVAI